MDEKLLHILQHSLGVDQYGMGSQYRNYFATSPGSKDFDECQKLVDLGFMEDLGTRKIWGDMHCFIVTRAGKSAVSTESPDPPKISRSKKRYMAYLRADCFESFFDFLKYNEQCRKNGEEYV